MTSDCHGLSCHSIYTLCKAELGGTIRHSSKSLDEPRRTHSEPLSQMRRGSSCGSDVAAFVRTAKGLETPPREQMPPEWEKSQPMFHHRRILEANSTAKGCDRIAKRQPTGRLSEHKAREEPGTMSHSTGEGGYTDFKLGPGDVGAAWMIALVACLVLLAYSLV